MDISVNNPPVEQPPGDQPPVDQFPLSAENTLLMSGTLAMMWRDIHAQSHIVDSILKGQVKLDQLCIAKIPGTSITACYLPSQIPDSLPKSITTNQSRPVDVILDEYLLGNGSIMPQKLWAPFTDSGKRELVADAELHLPVFFIGVDGNLGVHAQVIDEAGPAMMDEHETFDFGKTSIEIRVCLWPYQHVKYTINLGKKPVTRRQLAQRIFSRLKTMFEQPPELDIEHQEYGAWKIGSGGIGLNEVLLVGLVQVSSGSFTPIMQVTTPAFRWLPDRDQIFDIFDLGLLVPQS